MAYHHQAESVIFRLAAKLLLYVKQTKQLRTFQSSVNARRVRIINYVSLVTLTLQYFVCPHVAVAGLRNLRHRQRARNVTVKCVLANIFAVKKHKRHDFRKKKNILNIKCVFRISLHFFSETFFILRRTERGVIQGGTEPTDTFQMVIDNTWKQEKKYAKPSINTSKYAIYYLQITSLFSEHQADGLRLNQCIVTSVSGSCRTRAAVGPHQ